MPENPAVWPRNSFLPSHRCSATLAREQHFVHSQKQSQTQYPLFLIVVVVHFTGPNNNFKLGHQKLSEPLPKLSPTWHHDIKHVLSTALFQRQNSQSHMIGFAWHTVLKTPLSTGSCLKPGSFEGVIPNAGWPEVPRMMGLLTRGTLAWSRGTSACQVHVLSLCYGPSPSRNQTSLTINFEAGRNAEYLLAKKLGSMDSLLELGNISSGFCSAIGWVTNSSVIKR